MNNGALSLIRQEGVAFVHVDIVPERSEWDAEYFG